MNVIKRRFTPLASVRWLANEDGEYDADDRDRSIEMMVEALNGELLAGAADHEESLQWQQHARQVLDLLRRGIEGVAAFKAEEGRIYVSPGYPAFDDCSGVQEWLDKVEQARRAEYANLQAIDQLNRFLAVYEVTLTLEPTVSNDGDHVGWRFSEDFKRRDRQDVFDSLIVSEFIALARLGVLDRIRECACGRWFYASRGNQRSHVPQCRKRKYDRKRDKAQRADYMRWYYAMYQSPKAPTKKLTFKQWLKTREGQPASQHRNRERPKRGERNRRRQ